MEKLPGVAVAYPDSHVKGIKIRYGDKEATAIGLAMPREAALVGMADEILVAGRLFEEGDQPEAILGVQLAESLGFNTPQGGHRDRDHRRGRRPDVRRGQRVLLSAQGADGENRRRLPCPAADAGVCPAGHLSARRVDEADSRHVPGVGLEPIEGGRQPDGRRLCQRYGAGPRSGRSGRRWKRRSDGMGYHTQAILSKLQDMRRFFLAIQLLLTVVGSIALAIAALGIVNTLLMAVLERYQEIGLCKAIGASDGDLFVLFLTEAGIIGFLGGLTGIALGWLMSWGMEAAATVYAHRQGISGRLDLFAFPALAAGRLDRLCRRRQRGGRHLSRLAGRAGRSDPALRSH